jgi:hypothetical protein
MVQRWWIGVAALLVAGCASRPVPVPATIADVPPPVAPSALPPGATPGMLVPAALADGSYPTPNARVSTAAAIWHLRAGLNVAALACPAAQGAAITAAYNALLAGHKAELKAAEASYAAEYRAAGDPQWRDRYDGAMTRLYNFFSQTPVRTGFCAAAADVVTGIALVPAGGLQAAAPDALGRLDRPFVEFYRAYDAWRTSVARPVIAISATAQAAAPVRPPLSAATRDAAAPRLSPPRLELDLGKLPQDTLSGA